MSSEVDVIVSMDYVMSTCSTLSRIPEMEKAMPVVLWMSQEAERVSQHIYNLSSDVKKRRYWFRMAQRKAAALMQAKPDDDDTLVSLGESLLFLCSIMTQMLEDIFSVPKKGTLVDSLVDAAYQLEGCVPILKKHKVDEDAVHIEAGIMLSKINSYFATA